MKYGSLPLARAEGKILAHNISGPDGSRALKKGKSLTTADIAMLKDIGQTDVYVAELNREDVDENSAARRVALSVSGSGLELIRPVVGRVNIQAQSSGILRVDQLGLQKFNQFEEIAIATLMHNAVVEKGQVVAKVKIIPFAVPEQQLEEIEKIPDEMSAPIRLDELKRREASLILLGSASAKARIETRFEEPIQTRIEALGSVLQSVEFESIADNATEERLAKALIREKEAGSKLIIIAGETAIMDRNDIAPQAVEKAGGSLVSLGAPVDPGNLLMLAYIGDVPILGAPGCAGSKKKNIVDAILPRLLVGERLSREDVAALGHGGLLND